MEFLMRFFYPKFAFMNITSCVFDVHTWDAIYMAARCASY